MSVKVPSRHHILAALPCNSIIHIELAYLDSFCKVFDHGAVAWFTLVYPVEPLDAMGICGTIASGESGDA